MMSFAGWEIPVQYESTLKEHFAVRQTAGLFDVSHMGQLEIMGKDALKMSQKVTCNDVSRLSDGQAHYSAFLSPKGTFVDDIVVYRIHREHIFICVNAANKDKDVQWVMEHKEGNVEIVDQSNCYVQLAIQGPRAREILQPLTNTNLSNLGTYRFTYGRIQGSRALISRTGYTGEDGLELYLPPSSAESVWSELLELGRPMGLHLSGLAARNTLRLEVGYPLYGKDIDETTTPWEADLGRMVKLNKGIFIGREALVKLGVKEVKRKLVGFEMIDRGIARDHYPVYLDQEPVGKVSSGGFAPSLQKSIGLVYLPLAQTHIGQLLKVEVRGRRLLAKVVETPFYKRTTRLLS